MKSIRPSIAAIVLPILLLICLLISVCPVLAEGDGSGGGQDEALGLASSTPVNGAQKVPLDTRIKLVFNKNVVNMTVKENNLRCFSLYAGNLSVPVEVQMADDQIYPELKREVNLVLRQKLEPSTVYTVVISKSLQAKNGMALGQDLRLRFSTAAAEKVVPPPAASGEKVSGEAAASVKPGNDSQTESKAAESSGKQVAPPGTQAPGPSEALSKSSPEAIKQQPVKADDQESNYAWLWPALIVGIIILVAGYGYLRKRH